MENKSIMIAKKVTRSFPIVGQEPLLVLKNIDLEIKAESLTILKGRSGSGKTTLINLLGALDYPTSGEIVFDGEDITKASEAAREKMRRKKVGFIFQSVSLIPIMNVYENVEFALRLAEYEGDHRERTMECLRLVGLEKRIDHMPQELSGGEQQRVAIARAIAHKPIVIFADEPTAELDSATAQTVMKVFKDLVSAEKVTIVMTTHDMGLTAVSDDIYEVLDGEIRHTKMDEDVQEQVDEEAEATEAREATKATEAGEAADE
ncbi:MAG TPA: ABC transporter ATP-binding protein [Lachnospiraceae bacterium]|nr:ABC transporter ATP-binding protein [Lachnospiraceae bacterium]